MKLSDVKENIDKYFETVSPEEIVKVMEDAGFELEDVTNTDKTELNLHSVSECCCCNGTGIVEGEHNDDLQSCLTCNGSGR